MERTKKNDGRKKNKSAPRKNKKKYDVVLMINLKRGYWKNVNFFVIMV